MFVGKVEGRVHEIVAKGEAFMVKQVDALLADFKVGFSQDIKGEANELIGELNRRFNRDGFALDIRLPNVAPLVISYSASELLGDAVDSKSRTVTRYKRSSGVWGTVCSWFNSSDWGWESYKTRVDYYEVNIASVRLRINESVESLFKELRETTDTGIRAPLEQGVDQFFEQLKLTLENIRSDLAQSLLDKRNNQGDQQALKQRLAGLKRNVPEIRKDSEELKNDVQPSEVEVVA